jgi:hypothetical protein
MLNCYVDIDVTLIDDIDVTLINFNDTWWHLMAFFMLPYALSGEYVLPQ